MAPGQQQLRPPCWFTYMLYNNNDSSDDSVIHHIPNSVNVHAGQYNENNKSKIITTAPFGSVSEAESESDSLSKSVSKSE
jgi:hypothetical protein